jgi:hypothetical protein
MAHKEIKYGWREGEGKGKEVPVAADQYFHRQGGHFVTLNAAGMVSIASAAATQIYGWAETPKDTAGKNCWKSSSTAGVDKVFVIYGSEDIFELPFSATLTVTATHIGKGCDLQLDKTATYGQRQKAYYRATAASALVTIVDFDASASTVRVKIKPTKQISP